MSYSITVFGSAGQGLDRGRAADGLANDPSVKGGRRVRGSSEDESPVTPVAALSERLGFAPFAMAKLNEASSLVRAQARARTGSQVIFRDLVNFG